MARISLLSGRLASVKRIFRARESAVRPVVEQIENAVVMGVFQAGAPQRSQLAAHLGQILSRRPR
jgi:hypothetical protein